MPIMATANRRKQIRPVSRELVLKAKSDDPPVAVYSQSGKLLGICDPSAITPIAPTDGDEEAPAAKPAAQAQPAPAPAAAEPMTKAQARESARQMKKAALYSGGLAEDQNRAANQMNVAARQVLDAIHRQQPRRSGR